MFICVSSDYFAQVMENDFLTATVNEIIKASICGSDTRQLPSVEKFAFWIQNMLFVICMDTVLYKINLSTWDHEEIFSFNEIL